MTILSFRTADLIFRTADTERSALMVAARAYDELHDRLRSSVGDRLRVLVDETYERGRTQLEQLWAVADESELTVPEQDLLRMYLTSARADDPDQQMVWLDLLPESVSRLYASRSREELHRVAEEPIFYGSYSTRSFISEWQEQPLEVEVREPRERGTAAAV